MDDNARLAAAPSTPLIAIDPGKDKCGVAVVSPAGEVLARCIMATSALENSLPELLKTFTVACIVVGGATTSRTLRAKLSTLFPHMEVLTVEEKNSTLEARALYWQANPPRGWRRVLPLSLQAPPVPIDDFAAVVLAQRYFATAKK